jgi:hypothetical protein
MLNEQIMEDHVQRMESIFSKDFQQDIHPEERKGIHLRASNVFEYVPDQTKQGFKLIMSKRDLEQMILRGIMKGILDVGVHNISRNIKAEDDPIPYELDFEHLEIIAQQHFLSIKKILREVVGDEMYD